MQRTLFFRINRQQIVNLDYIENIESWFSGGLKIWLRGGRRVRGIPRAAVHFDKVELVGAWPRRRLCGSGCDPVRRILASSNILSLCDRNTTTLVTELMPSNRYSTFLTFDPGFEPFVIIGLQNAKMGDD